MATHGGGAKLGIIAGGGALPGLLVSACQSLNRPYYVLGLSGFADDAALRHPAHAWVRLGEVGKALTLLREAGVDEVVMAGAVQRPRLDSLKPDFKGAALLARIVGKALGDDSLLSVVVGEFEREGFTVVGADDILADLLTPVGVLGRVRPGAQAEEDIRYGFGAARALGAADVGQAVVVRGGSVIETEGPDGTDAMLARVKEGGGVLVKVKKPQQERRVDLPTIGPDTIANAASADLVGIAVEAGQTLMIDRVNVVAAADSAGLFVVGVRGDVS